MNNKKILVMTTLLLAIIILGVGTISYFRRAVNGNITGQTGILVFNVNGLTGETSETLNYSLNRSSEEPYVMPDDSGYFDLEITAEGSSTDVYVTLDIIRVHLPDNLKFYLDEEHKVVVNKKYFFFEKTEDMSETLRIYWFWDGSRDDENDSLFMNESLSARISLTAIPMEYGVMKNGIFDALNTGEFVGPYSLEYWTLVKNITFTKDFTGMPEECTEENLCWDISYDENQKYSVYAYLIETDELGVGMDLESNPIEGNLYELYIVCAKTVFAPSDSSMLFGALVNLNELHFNNHFNTSLVNNMFRMFSGNALINLDLSILDTSNVVNMNGMFLGCSSLTNLNLQSFDTSSVTDMNNMFEDCSSLENLDLSSFNTSGITEINRMFDNCSSLISLNVSSFNTSSVTDMNAMFGDCSNLISLDLSSFDTESVTDMNNMFYNCSSLENLDLSSFDTGSVTAMNNMFHNCSSLENLDLSIFDTGNVVNMNGMFSGCSSLTNLNLQSFDISGVTSLDRMFYNCSSLVNLDLISFNVSRVVSMQETFYNCSNLASLNLNWINSIKLVDIENMFYGCSNLKTTLTISSAITFYDNALAYAATEQGSEIIVNYVSGASGFADRIIATKSNNSNVVKGEQV